MYAPALVLRSSDVSLAIKKNQAEIPLAALSFTVVRSGNISTTLEANGLSR